MNWVKSLLIVCLWISSAQSIEPQDIVFTSMLDGSQQRYVELFPQPKDVNKRYDVVIALHGHGSDRWQFIHQARGECQGVRDVASKHGLIVVAPDYRAPTSWMGPAAEADMLQIVAELKQRHRIDRVFLAGGSMGGTSALIFAALYPDVVAGVCCLNGTANMQEYQRFKEAIASSYGGTKQDVPDEYKKRSAELWPERFTMPLAVTTGGQDEIVPPHSVLRLVAKLKQVNRRVLSIHREAGGHSTDYEDTCAAMEFMLQQANPGLHEVQSIKEELVRLEAKIADLRVDNVDALADVAIFAKAIKWALRYDEPLTQSDGILLKSALVRGAERTESISAHQLKWTKQKGKVIRAFVSVVDGSIQPYGVVVPHSYDGTQAFRLDVVLHGSSKPTGMSELKFISRFDVGDADSSGPDVNYIELHPLGRVENCYRWAGETDVFEAIEAVCRNYRIDRDRIVIRGMSMGASGTWHLGLKHPDRFVAIGPYCGYVDTHLFSQTPVPNFIKVGPLPEHQELGLHMLDSVDYAANAGIVPTIAAMGEKDVFFQAHVIMGSAVAKEGLTMVNLISPGTGHVIDPVTHGEQLRRIGEHAAAGLDRDPRQIRFVTWTLKYNRCHWLELLGLENHYERAEFRAQVAVDDVMEVKELRNITQFAIHRPVAKLRIAGFDIALPPHQPSDVLVFSKVDQNWRCAGLRSLITLVGKRPGLQGPIDDAFATPFLCVRGTGKPWNAGIQDWATASLRRFEYEWARYMRGNLPVKNDSDVTEADVREKHLILFGDPGSNSWLAKALPQLPVKWSSDQVRLFEQTYSANDHCPIFICASPLAANRYLVVNSGHTFHEREFAAFNYLLFPRLGDWAVTQVQPGSSEWLPTSRTFPEQIIAAGFFDETWQRMRRPVVEKR